MSLRIAQHPEDRRRVRRDRPLDFQLLTDRTLLLLQMQAYAACDDPEVRAATRAGFKGLWELTERLTGLPFQQVVDFFAVGMLMNVAAAMDLPSVDERWTSWCPK
jgi:hypothetical protein